MSGIYKSTEVYGADGMNKLQEIIEWFQKRKKPYLVGIVVYEGTKIVGRSDWFVEAVNSRQGWVEAKEDLLTGYNALPEMQKGDRLVIIHIHRLDKWRG